MKVVGTCSLCHGPVIATPLALDWRVERVRCDRCGAVPAQRFGPVMPMVADETSVQARQLAELKRLDREAAERDAVPRPRVKAKCDR